MAFLPLLFGVFQLHYLSRRARLQPPRRRPARWPRAAYAAGIVEDEYSAAPEKGADFSDL
jgi:hypothetical protein